MFKEMGFDGLKFSLLVFCIVVALGGILGLSSNVLGMSSPEPMAEVKTTKFEDFGTDPYMDLGCGFNFFAPLDNSKDQEESVYLKKIPHCQIPDGSPNLSAQWVCVGHFWSIRPTGFFSEESLKYGADSVLDSWHPLALYFKPGDRFSISRGYCAPRWLLDQRQFLEGLRVEGISLVGTFQPIQISEHLPSEAKLVEIGCNVTKFFPEAEGFYQILSTCGNDDMYNLEIICSGKISGYMAYYSEGYQSFHQVPQGSIPSAVWIRSSSDMIFFSGTGGCYVTDQSVDKFFNLFQLKVAG